MAHENEPKKVLTPEGIEVEKGHVGVEDRLFGVQKGSESGRLQSSVFWITRKLIDNPTFIDLTPVQRAFSLIRTRKESEKPEKGGVPAPRKYQDQHKDRDLDSKEKLRR